MHSHHSRHPPPQGWWFGPFLPFKNTQTDFKGWKSPEDTDSDSEHLLSFIDCSVFSPLQCFKDYTNKHIEVRDRNGDKQTMNHLVSSLTREEASMRLYYGFTPSECVCVYLTKSIWVCVSEFCRRCWGVLKVDEGEEWGLSKAWGRRRSREDEGGGMSGTVSHTDTCVQSTVYEKAWVCSLPPGLLRLSPSTVDLQQHRTISQHLILL